MLQGLMDSKTICKEENIPEFLLNCNTTLEYKGIGSDF